MADKRGLWKLFQDLVEALETSVEDAFGWRVWHFLEMKRKRHVQFRCCCIQPPHLRAIGLYVILDFTKAVRSRLYCRSKQCNSVRRGHVRADGIASKPRWLLCHEPLCIVGARQPGEQVRCLAAGAIQMCPVRFYGWALMKMAVDDR